MRVRLGLCALLLVTTAPSPGWGASATSRAFLYEMAFGAAQETAFEGFVKWSYADRADVGPTVGVDVRVPERGLRIRISLHRNKDATLPAAHLIELMVETDAEFPGKSIRSIARLVMKPIEKARGQPLVGAAAKVTKNLFWIALSDTREDVSANLDLLQSYGWIDLPLIYETGQEATLTFGKGIQGAEALAKAVAIWAQAFPPAAADGGSPETPPKLGRGSIYPSVSPPPFDPSH